MYSKCIGITKTEDAHKVIEFLKRENISYKEDSALSLFEDVEIHWRLTEMYQIVDQNGNKIELTPNLLEELIQSVDNAEYIDLEYIDQILEETLKTYDYILGKRPQIWP